MKYLVFGEWMYKERHYIPPGCQNTTQIAMGKHLKRAVPEICILSQ